MKHFLLHPHTKHEAQLLSETRTGTEEQLQKFKLAEEELAQVKDLVLSTQLGCDIERDLGKSFCNF